MSKDEYEGFEVIKVPSVEENVRDASRYRLARSPDFRLIDLWDEVELDQRIAMMREAGFIGGGRKPRPSPAKILEINSEVRRTEDEFSFCEEGSLLITHKDIEEGETMALCSFLLSKEDVEHLRDWLNRHHSKDEE